MAQGALSGRGTCLRGHLARSLSKCRRHPGVGAVRVTHRYSMYGRKRLFASFFVFLNPGFSKMSPPGRAHQESAGSTPHHPPGQLFATIPQESHRADQAASRSDLRPFPQLTALWKPRLQAPPAVVFHRCHLTAHLPLCLLRYCCHR